MAFKQFNCPSCGAELQLQYRFSQMVVCPFCDQTSHLSGEGLLAQGEKIKLADYGSKFFTGATGTIFNTNFRVFGRLRLEYPDGFWDEWLIRLENDPEKEYWLQEDEGEYILFEKSDKLPDNSNFDKTNVGDRINFESYQIFISEKNNAKIIGGEGELPHRIKPGEQCDFIDGIIIGKAIPTSLEFMPDNKTAFYYSIKPVTLNDFKFTPKPENPYM